MKEFKNVEILQTRTTDIFLTLKERTQKANSWGAHCFLSVHINAHNDKAARGFESYIYNGNVSERTISFQNVLHGEIIKQIGKDISDDKGKKRGIFSCAA